MVPMYMYIHSMNMYSNVCTWYIVYTSQITFTGILLLLLPSHLQPNITSSLFKFLPQSMTTNILQWTLDGCVDFTQRMAKSHKGSMSVENIYLQVVVANFRSNCVSGNDMLLFSYLSGKI
jgi:hypothetical protein